jgi:hypothetical protein
MSSDTDRAVFVCNLPGHEPGLTEVLEIGLTSGVRPPVVVRADPSWRRVGRNLVGPPYGELADPDDVGIYEVLDTSAMED